eukprot:3671020-Lingulodinium_polyedra.AAC.1
MVEPVPLLPDSPVGSSGDVAPDAVVPDAGVAPDIPYDVGRVLAVAPIGAFPSQEIPAAPRFAN